MSDDLVSEADLQAYVDGQLDAAGRLEVADHLVRHPEAAARVLADLRSTEAIRTLAGHDAAMPPRLVQAARQLDRMLLRRRVGARLTRFAGIAAMVLIGTTIGFSVDSLRIGVGQPAKAAVPVYIEEALMSHRTALVRREMRSQPETAHFDPGDVRSATHISVPRLPGGWRILDVQLFPSDYGPSLQIVVDAGQKTPLSLFAARARTGVSRQPVAHRIAGQDLSYWSRDGMIYVLTGDASEVFLKKAADDLSDNQDA